jgi:CheY-like chemotaxis protein
MSNHTILVADDSPTDLNLMANVLRSRGYQIITAVDGEEALQKASMEQPQVIVLDILLPGFQGCRQLKTTPATAHSRVILISGKNQESDRFWGLKRGADEYVTSHSRMKSCCRPWRATSDRGPWTTRPTSVVRSRLTGLREPAGRAAAPYWNANPNLAVQRPRKRPQIGPLSLPQSAGSPIIGGSRRCDPPCWEVVQR